MRRFILSLCIFFVVISMIAAAPAQRLSKARQEPVDTPMADLPNTVEHSGYIPRKILLEMEQRRQRERFESLKKDTEKLLLLSGELKKAVEAANDNTLSLDVIRKSEEVEKLAKQVRKKIKNE